MSDGIEGHGTTLLFATSEFAPNLISVDGPAISRGSIPTTHMGTTVALTSVPAKLYSVEGLDITIEHLGGEAIPVSEDPETITIDWAGDDGAGTWAFSGYMTDYAPGATSGERQQATCTLHGTGPLTITPDA